MVPHLNSRKLSILLVIVSWAASVHAVDHITFDYFKNSGFQDLSTCPTSSYNIPSSTCNSTTSTCYAQARNQTSFCSHFSDLSSFTVLPTHVTSAAYLESWSSTLLQAAVMIMKYLLASTAVRCIRPRKPNKNVATNEMLQFAPNQPQFPLPSFQSTYNYPQPPFARPQYPSSPTSSSIALMVEHDASIKTSFAPSRENIVDTPISNWTFYPFLLYDIASIALWWFQTVRGFVDPPHAPWLNPSSWLTPAWYWIVAQSLGLRGWALFAALFTLGQLFTTMFTFYYKFKFPTTGAVSYSLISSMVSLSDVSTQCANVVNDPFNAIYSDPQVKRTKSIQLGLFACTLITLAVCSRDLFRLNSHEVFVNRMRRRFIIVSVLSMLGSWILIGFTIMFVYSFKGTPFMWNEPCKVVVVALSAKLGYWDVQGEKGWRIAKAILGL